MQKARNPIYNGVKKKTPEEEIRGLNDAFLQRLGIKEDCLKNYAKLSDITSPDGCLPHLFYVVRALGIASKEQNRYLLLLHSLDSVSKYFSRGEKSRQYTNWRIFCQEIRHVAELIGGRELEIKVFHDAIDTHNQFLKLTKKNSTTY